LDALGGQPAKMPALIFEAGFARVGNQLEGEQSPSARKVFVVVMTQELCHKLMHTTSSTKR
jgi:hypothetical protein